MTTGKTATSKPKGPLFPRIVGIGMLVLAGVDALIGSDWYVSLGLAACGVLVLLWLGRPVFRSAVYRSGAQEVVCRYVPWYQANAIATSVALPLIGIAMIAAGSAAVGPAWLRYGGYFILALGAAFALLSVFMGLTNQLRFTPSVLALRIGRNFEVSRESFVSIKPRALTGSAAWEGVAHFDLVYAPADGGSNRAVMVMDRQFSVETANLAAALQAWKDGDANDPGLIDRIERILRGQSPAGT